MGPESKNDYILYLRDATSGDIPIAPGIIHEITVSADALTQEALQLLEPMEFTMHIETPKRWHCGSRKRFIKLLMSKGISRNQAGSVARVARIAGVPYGELWRDYFFWG